MASDSNISAVLRLVAATVGAVLWVTSPLAVAIMLNTRVAPDQPNETEDYWIPLESGGQISLQAELRIEWSEDESVRAPSWHGVISSVNVSDGVTIRDGDVLAHVDGVSRRYFTTSSAFFRPLCYGDSGADASELLGVLRRAGVTTVGGKTITWDAREAIREYAELIGVEDAHRVACFDPGWIVTGDSDEFLIDEVRLSRGELAPGPGSEILISEVRLVQATVLRNGDPLESDSGTQAGPVEVLIAGVNVGQPSGLINGGSGIAELERLVESGSQSLDILLLVQPGKEAYIVPSGALSAGPAPQCVVVRREAYGATVVPVTAAEATLSGLLVWIPGGPWTEVRVSPRPSSAECAS